MLKSFLLILSFLSIAFAAPVQISGIYPHLAMQNSQNECGVGAVVPWNDKFWAVT